MQDFLRSLWQDESGQDLAEYAMLVVLIALGLIAVVGAFGTTLGGIFEDAGTKLSEGVPGEGTG